MSFEEAFTEWIDTLHGFQPLSLYGHEYYVVGVLPKHVAMPVVCGCLSEFGTTFTMWNDQPMLLVPFHEKHNIPTVINRCVSLQAYNIDEHAPAAPHNFTYVRTYVHPPIVSLHGSKNTIITPAGHVYTNNLCGVIGDLPGSIRLATKLGPVYNSSSQITYTRGIKTPHPIYSETMSEMLAQRQRAITYTAFDYDTMVKYTPISSTPLPS